MTLSENQSDALLPNAARSGRISHSYIIAGDETGALALSLAAVAVCSSADTRPCRTCRDCIKAGRGVHPDIIITQAEPGREIVVDSARAIRQDASVMPNEANRKAYIIKNADMMNKAAQNAMLKLLEEPPGNAVFILDAQDPSALLATVRSRCVLLKAAPGAKKGGETSEDGEVRELAHAFIAALHHGALELCAFSFKLDRLDRAGLSAFLDEAERQAIELLKKAASEPSAKQPAEKYSRAVRAVSRAKDYARQNVSAGHVSGMLCAELI